MENSKSFPSPEESVWKRRLVRLAWLFTGSLQVCNREVVLVSSFSISGAAAGLQKHIIISPFNYIKHKKKGAKLLQALSLLLHSEWYDSFKYIEEWWVQEINLLIFQFALKNYVWKAVKYIFTKVYLAAIYCICRS